MSEVIGTKELIQKLNKLGEVGKGRAMINALVAGGLEISNEAKINAPYITGTLERSIHIGGHVSESAPGFTPHDVAGDYSDIGGEKIESNAASILIGTNLVYAKRLEFGFNGPDKLGRIYHQPAQPYLRPAVDTKKERAFKVIGEALKIQIDKVK